MKVKEFRELNESNDILHIGNVWDVQSALIMKESGYKVLGTSSFAIAESLGYKDGEEMEFEDLYNISKQIISKVKMPLSVDIEAGYSRDTAQIIKNIIALYEIGVVGINLEDSIMVDKKRQIVSKEVFANLLKEIKAKLQAKNIDIYINARTDYFIMGLDNPLENTLERIKLYEQNGADGIFVPFVTDINDIKQIVKETSLPLNVVARPELGDFDTLQNAGVKRVSQGPFVYKHFMGYFNDMLSTIDENKSFKSLF